MRYKLRLYVTGRSAQSQQAINNLRAVLDSAHQCEYDVEVVDVLEHPELAEKDKILATPTLVKMRPEPIRKIVGDLSERDKVVRSLDLVLSAEAASPDGTDDNS